MTLYQGGQYFLYKYKRYDDVRLVFAPEQAIAAFGGDPDNFNFPRWCLDFSLMRVYENGKPARTPDYLRWRAEGPRAGDPVFVPGHPGSTSRLLTVEQLKFNRSVTFPQYIARNSELRGRMIEWGKTGDEPQRIVQENLLGLENSLKVYRGLQSALLDDRLMDFKTTRERELRERVSERCEARATDRQRVGRRREVAGALSRNLRPLPVPGERHGLQHRLVRLRAPAGARRGRARQAERAAAARVRGLQSAEDERRTAGRDADLSRVRNADVRVLARQDARERSVRTTTSCAACWARSRPSRSRAKLVRETKLADPAVRKALWEGGAAAVEASQDPMIALARSIDADARALRKIYEDEVQARVVGGQEKIAKARFAALRHERLSRRDVHAAAQLRRRAQLDRERSAKSNRSPSCRACTSARPAEHPFSLPQRWLDARSKLDPNMPFNYVTTNDIVGGNSGSPAVDAQGRLVGLLFDGNIHSIAGSYWYDESLNRAVAVHPAIILTALREVYGAEALATKSWGRAGSAFSERSPLLRHDRELDVQPVLHFERAERHAERLDSELRLQDVELAARRQLRALDCDLHRHLHLTTQRP